MPAVGLERRNLATDSIRQEDGDILHRPGLDPHLPPLSQDGRGEPESFWKDLPPPEKGLR